MRTPRRTPASATRSLRPPLRPHRCARMRRPPARPHRRQRMSPCRRAHGLRPSRHASQPRRCPDLPIRPETPRQTPRRSRPHLLRRRTAPPGNPRRHPRRKRLAQPRSTRHRRQPRRPNRRRSLRRLAGAGPKCRHRRARRPPAGSAARSLRCRHRGPARPRIPSPPWPRSPALHPCRPSRSCARPMSRAGKPCRCRNPRRMSKSISAGSKSPPPDPRANPRPNLRPNLRPRLRLPHPPARRPGRARAHPHARR